jgi:hypothetical protein
VETGSISLEDLAAISEPQEKTMWFSYGYFVLLYNGNRFQPELIMDLTLGASPG